MKADTKEIKVATDLNVLNVDLSSMVLQVSGSITHNVPSIAVRCGFNSTNFQKQIKDEYKTKP